MFNKAARKIRERMRYDATYRWVVSKESTMLSLSCHQSDMSGIVTCDTRFDKSWIYTDMFVNGHLLPQAHEQHAWIMPAITCIEGALVKAWYEHSDQPLSIDRTALASITDTCDTRWLSPEEVAKAYLEDEYNRALLLPVITSMTEWGKEIHRLAKEKGWYDEKLTYDAYIERLCNSLHDEISELHEAWREGGLHETCDKVIPLTRMEEEFADIILRILDATTYLNIDAERIVKRKHKYNCDRAYRHGNKKG